MKSLLQSKTFWLATVQALIGMAVVFSTAYPSVGFLVLAKSALDIVLRVMTSTTIAALGSSTQLN